MSRMGECGAGDAGDDVAVSAPALADEVGIELFVGRMTQHTAGFEDNKTHEGAAT